MTSIQFNFTKMKSIYMEAINSYDKSAVFDIRIGRGQFLFMMFLSEEDEKDSLFLYMRNTAIMRKLKMYGSHRNGDFKVYIADEIQARMTDELQLKKGNNTFDFNKFLNEINDAIPQQMSIGQKAKILKENRNVIKTIGIDEKEKTVLIGTKVLSKGKPRDRTLRKLYIYTEESEPVITQFIQQLKKANMTVAWTTEEQGYKAAAINTLINCKQ